MATVNFGFGINKPRVIDLDRNNLRKSDEILREMPELQTCIGCGACTALCTAGNLTSFNFRKVHTLVRRGEYEGAYEEMNPRIAEYLIAIPVRRRSRANCTIRMAFLANRQIGRAHV